MWRSQRRSPQTDASVDTTHGTGASESVSGPTQANVCGTYYGPVRRVGVPVQLSDAVDITFPLCDELRRWWTVKKAKRHARVQ